MLGVRLVTLEFEKIRSQVERMGRMLAHLSEEQSERAENAWEILESLGDLNAVWERIQLVRERDAMYRGAGIPDPSMKINEPLNQPYPLPSVPEHATILAADGSQVYPNTHASALYYLINVAVFTYYHGDGALPDSITEPALHYTESDLQSAQGDMISNAVVNALRTVQELHMLSREAWKRIERPYPLLAISDGPLLWWSGPDVPQERMEEYIGFLRSFYDIHDSMQRQHGQPAGVVGYVDRPNKPHLVSLVYLMSLIEQEIKRGVFDSYGDFSGLRDELLMTRLLEPGDRSAIMVQQSPQNVKFRDKGENFEVAFFYLNVSKTKPYHIVRVELPMWVARNPQMVNYIHALLYDQCQMMWRYPYVLTRADELAVVRNDERKKLIEMIEIELRRNDQPVEQSQKDMSKTVRHGRTRYGQHRR